MGTETQNEREKLLRKGELRGRTDVSGGVFSASGSIQLFPKLFCVLGFPNFKDLPYSRWRGHLLLNSGVVVRKILGIIPIFFLSTTCK